MIISSFKKLHKNNRELFYRIVFAVVLAANMIMLHFFVKRRFVDSIKPVSKIFGISEALSGILCSLIVGGILVLAVIKLCELVTNELKVISNKLFIIAFPTISLAVHLLVLLVLWIANAETFPWICTSLAYMGGLVFWLPALPKQLELVRKKKEEENEPAGFFD